VGHTEGGITAQNLVGWIDETSMPPYSLSSQVKYLLSISLVTVGDRLLPDLAPCSQVMFPAAGEISSEYVWPASHTLSSLGSEVGTTQLAQAQPPPDDLSPSTTSILNFQSSASYPGSHNLES
jgi:hypothetical protein